MKGINIKYLLAATLFCFFVGHIKTQELLPQIYDTTSVNQQVVISGGFLQHSSYLHNSIVRPFLFGGEIGENDKNNAWETIDGYDRIGGGYHGRFEYRAGKQIFKNNENWSWMMNLSNEAHVQGQYTGDLFGLVFIGNEPFLGKEADIESTYARFDQFWTIGGGIHHKKTKSFVTLNVVLPQNFFETDVDGGRLRFSKGGESIRLITDGEVYLANQIPYFKGIGGSVNFDYNFSFGDSSKFNGIISIQGRNIGFVKLRNTTRYNFDIDEEYSGFSISDLTAESKLPSLMDTLGIESGEKSIYRLLPGFVQVGKIAAVNSEKKVQSFFGLRMYTTKLYRPLIYAGAHYRVNHEFSLGGQIAYGGYGGLRLGIYFNYNTENVVVGLGTEDILGLLLKKQYGHSGLIRIAWKL